MPPKPPAAPRARPLMPHESPVAGAAGTQTEGRTPVLRSEDILRGHRAVEILHAGLRYRLSVTSMGKLILTK